MSPVETSGKIAGGVVDSLKAQPLSLALVVMNLALIGFIYMQGTAFNTQRAENVKLFLEVQREVQKLLSQCIIPPPQTFRPGTFRGPPDEKATGISQGEEGK